MYLGVNEVARLIDVSAVRTPHGKAEIVEVVGYAKKYRFVAVHVLPCWVSFLKEQLVGEKDIFVGAPVGFPSGAHTTRIKLLEADQLIADGVQEMDMMLNVGKFRSGEYDYVEDEIRQIVLAAGEKNVLVKVILEVYFLTPDEIRKACELCIKAGAEYIKTATGWAPHGATPEVISLITSFVGSAIKVKAAGSIRDLATLMDMYRMGVSRFGINVNASMDIIKELTALPNSRIEV